VREHKPITNLSLFTLLLVLLPSVGLADTSVKATIDRTNVPVGEEILLKITVQSDEETVDSPRFEELTAFDIISSGSSKNLQWINGQTSVSFTYQYRLRARDEGEFTIGPATVRAGGKEYRTRAFKVRVTPARTQPPSQQQQQQQPPPNVSEPVTPPSNRHIFITADLDRDTAYINQPVTYTFRFYKAERLLSSPSYERPSFPGFWVEELPPQRHFNRVINGVNYEVTEVRYALFPTDAGPKRIAPSRLKATIASRSKGRRNPFSIFGDDIFGRFDRGEAVNLTTKPISLTVLPLPADGKPDDFSGLVGKFSLDIHADQLTASVGDPLTVTLTVQGRGNIKSAPMPSFDTIPGLRTFAAGSSEEVSTANYQISGRKTFDQVFVPQRPGKYQLPEFKLSYFDPEARRYKTLTTERLEITATGAAADFTIPSLRLNPDEISDLAADVRMIRTEGTNLRHYSAPGMLGWPFWVGHALPFLALITFLGWRHRALRIAADPVGQKRRLAFRSALSRLQVEAGTTDDGQSLEGVAAALLQYYGDRFNRPAHGVLRQDMKHDFLSDGVAENEIGEYLALLDECDRGRYARSASHPVADVAARARDILTRLEATPK
jgi:hypothetical protein